MFTSLFYLAARLIYLLDLFCLFLVIFLCSFLPTKRFQCARSLFNFLIRRWCIIFAKTLGIDLAVHEHYAKSLPKQFIVIANHPSLFEDMGMPTFFQARFVAKIEVDDWWFVGRAARAFRTMYVKRECKDSRKEVRRLMRQAIDEGDNVAIFPEGGCKGRRIWTPFTSGAFDLSMDTGVPIIPVFIEYEAQEGFEWGDQSTFRKLWELFWVRNKRANYHIYDPLYPSQFTDREHYRKHTESLYLSWQEKYLL